MCSDNGSGRKPHLQSILHEPVDPSLEAGYFCDIDARLGDRLHLHLGLGHAQKTNRHVLEMRRDGHPLEAHPQWPDHMEVGHVHADGQAEMLPAERRSQNDPHVLRAQVEIPFEYHVLPVPVVAAQALDVRRTLAEIELLDGERREE